MGEGEDSLGGPKIQAGNFPEIKKKKGGEKLGGQPREREWTPMPVVCNSRITSPHVLVLLMLPVLGFSSFFFTRMERGMSAASREAEKGLIANRRNR